MPFRNGNASPCKASSGAWAASEGSPGTLRYESVFLFLKSHLTSPIIAQTVSKIPSGPILACDSPSRGGVRQESRLERTRKVTGCPSSFCEAKIVRGGLAGCLGAAHEGSLLARGAIAVCVCPVTRLKMEVACMKTCQNKRSLMLMFCPIFQVAANLRCKCQGTQDPLSNRWAPAYRAPAC